MTSERWARLKQIFGDVLTKPESEREPFLESACEGDPELLHEARELLRGNSLAAERASSPGVSPSTRSPQPPSFAAQQLVAGRFRIVRFLARGGMGEVYEAEDTVLGQRVALKTIQPGGVLETDAIELLKHEIQSARRVTHANVCRTYDIAEHTEPRLMLLTMELLDGLTLSRFVREHGPFSRQQALPLIEQIAAGLQAAHDAGVIHGDFKAANVILTRDTLRPVITDFGLAQFPGSRTRAHAGTPGYMAPEQVEHKATTTATDVYAFGMVIAAMIGVQVTDRKMEHAGSWKKVLAKCLATDPAERYQKPGDVARALRRATSGRSWKLAGIVATLFAAGLAAGIGLYTNALPVAAPALLARRLDIPVTYSVSPDGQWLAGSTPQNIFLRHTKTGEVRLLPPGAAPVVSPDGRSVAYTFYNPAAREPELRIVATLPGARSRMVVRGRRGPNPVAWSPDGASILATRQMWDTLEFVWVSISDGSVREIKTLETWQTLGLISAPGMAVTDRARMGRRGHPSLSPDGRHVAYSALSRKGAMEQSIYVLAADGSSEIAVVQGGINEEPVWTPDGSRLLFTSNRSGTFGLWSVPMRDGNVNGNPTLVKADIGRIRSFGMGRSGTYYYDFQTGTDQVYLVSTDQGGGHLRTDTGPPLGTFVGVKPAWSHDGQWLAFKRWRTSEGDGYELVIRSMQTGAEWTFRPRTGYLGGAQPVWSLDGRVMDDDPAFQFTVRDGEPKEVEDALKTPFPTHAMSGGVPLSYQSTYRGPRVTSNPRVQAPAIEVLNAQNGQRRSLIYTPDSSFGPPALSPDGRTLAFFGRLQIWTMQTSGASLRKLYSGSHYSSGNGTLSFTADGRGILFVRLLDDGTTGIMRIPTEGGAPEFTGIKARSLAGFSLNPDGSRIAYSAPAQGFEAWALDNVASAWNSH